ncbi:Acetyltransferase Pat [compost metagenome]|uniref:Acetyltransferase (GNAT) family protein n=1 Tax=Pseudomonas jinjuensis TaxID=198616 RepID=A0A1H0L199_9PSED|nr:GNAT family N-acetyltransferase [Pseudomonas jinjuensis]SDO61855.1 Acetyltransferase (GNAT) family protein [Pseudomonas jinjuensis]
MQTSQTSAVSEKFAALAADQWVEELDDGRHVLIRPLRAEDRDRERDFLNRLSPVTRRLRFQGEIKVSESLLDHLMNIDYAHSMAFIALVHDDGELREIGVSRYADSGDGRHCECAVTIADDWQRRGLDLALMRHLIDVARRNGFEEMYSFDSASDARMRELAIKLGFHSVLNPDDATQIVRRLEL